MPSADKSAAVHAGGARPDSVGVATAGSASRVEDSIPALAASLSALAASHAAGGTPRNESGIDGGAARYLGRFTDTDVRAAAHPGIGTNADRWRTADWKARPNTIVALSFRAIPAGADVKGLAPLLALLEPRDGKLALLAEASLSFPHTNCSNETGEAQGEDVAPSLELDLAPYLISPGNTAIGVRLNCHTTFGSGEGDDSRLKLLELHASTLRVIFDEQIGWDNHDRVHGDTSARGVLIVQKTAHAGYFDLVIRTTDSTLGNIHDDGKIPKQAGLETRRFLWVEDHYAP